MSPARRDDSPLAVRHLDLSYDPENSEASARQLIFSLNPDWRQHDSELTFVRFTDGITNTLLKAERRQPGKDQSEIDNTSVLLRAYGEGTDVLIDREREVRAHSILAAKGMAPPLFARFNNGLLYKFIAGDVCKTQDIQRPEIYRAVAEKLGQWHGALPIAVISGESNHHSPPDTRVQMNGDSEELDTPLPNMWSITQSWIHALPSKTDEQRRRNKSIQTEFDSLKARLIKSPTRYGRHYVFGHCDLLLGNVILLKSPSSISKAQSDKTPSKPLVDFIDYEYAAPAPAAFDIANHFAEWTGMDCNYDLIPTVSQRRDFIRHYVASYSKHFDPDLVIDKATDALFDQVDLFRGLPGFYWGVWSLIQAEISQIDFDYAAYADLRFGEYYAWKAETTGVRAERGDERPPRELRWFAE